MFRLNKRVLLQALLALTFDLGGILSGRLVLTFYPIFESAPWVLAIFPPILSVRGNIGGIFSGKLSTMLHIGEVQPGLSGNTNEFYSLIRSVFFLTFIDTIGIGVLAFIVNSFFGNTSPQHLPFFIIVPVISCLLAITIVLPVVTLIGGLTFKKGLDPAIFIYPAMSTIDDVVVTVCYVLVVNLVFVPGALSGMAIAIIILGFLFSIILVKHRGERTFRRTLIEGGPMILLSSLLGNFGGVVLASLRKEIERKPSILMLYPALMTTMGDIGSILGNLETTKLALGYVRSFWETLKETFADLISVEIAAAILHMLFGLVAYILGKVTGLEPNLLLLINISIFSNLISFLFVSFLSILVATQTFKYGLDPDNFVIPLVTSVSDIGATLALMAALTLLRV